MKLTIPAHDGRRSMKWSTLAIGLTVTVALVAPATAQQSLGDVRKANLLSSIVTPLLNPARDRPVGLTVCC